jgi:hypothetical protein
MVMNTSAKRLLGPLERYSVLRSRLGIYQNVCVTASYLRECTDALEPELFRALAHVISSHPVLGAVPVESDAEIVFTRLGKIDLNQVVSFRQIPRPDEALLKGYLDKELEEQHNRGFTGHDPGAAFWRLQVWYDADDSAVFVIIFCFHHALMDTKSALIVLEDLEFALSHPGSNEASSLVATSNSMINPPLELLLDLGSSPEFLQRQKNLGEPPSHVWSGAPQSIPSTTSFSTLWLSARDTTMLRHQCKLHGTTITALLMSIIARSCFEALGSEYTVIFGDCAASLRRFFSEKLGDRTLGCYVTGFTQAYSRDSSCIWDDTKRTNITISDTLKRRGVDSSSSFLQTVPDVAQWLKDKQGKRRWPAWELSNVGTVRQVSGDGTGSYSMQSLLFSQSSSACSGAIKISTASGRDERLSLGLSYQRDVVEKRLIEEIKINLSSWVACLVMGASTDT